jgi:hypothetical protein
VSKDRCVGQKGENKVHENESGAAGALGRAGESRGEPGRAGEPVGSVRARLRIVRGKETNTKKRAVLWLSGYSGGLLIHWS